MKRNRLLLGAVAMTAMALFLITGCNQAYDEETPIDQTTQARLLNLPSNPSPDQLGKIPAATVQLLSFPPQSRLKAATSGSSWLEPASLEKTLKTGQSVTEKKTAHLTGAPPIGDVMFTIDLTGSMGGELENVKVNSVNIMNQIRMIIADSKFGVISHMDYNGFFSGCGYSAPYGSGPDYPYALNQSLTSSNTVVAGAISGLNLGYGDDGPEDYTRVLYETTADASIGWRSGAKKIVVAWLDAIPHDCNVFGILGGSGSTGPDPGRDGVAGTPDDLAILPVLDQMAAQNITLIVLHSGGSLDLWKAYAAKTGGDAFQINSDGTIPGGSDIATFIAGIIQSEVSKIDKLTLEVCTPGYAGWLTSVTPASYTDIVLGEDPLTYDFDIAITVPAGTPDGVYEFDVCLVGDGVVYGKQHVKITVKNAVEVGFDVHPTSCPNPINRTGNGVMPAAILGSAGLDVTQIDPASILINGVAVPVRWSIEDVSTPYMPYVGKKLSATSCNTLGPDGYADLTLKFNLQDIASLLAGNAVGDVVKLSVTGKLLDGTDIVGEDIIIIRK